MEPIKIVVQETRGYVFHGIAPNTFVFVPEECTSESAGTYTIDEVRYFLSGWARKNMLLNETEDVGSRLFAQEPVFDRTIPGLDKFLARLAHLQ